MIAKYPHLAQQGTRITAAEAELLEKVAANLDIAADLAHADLFLLALPAGRGKPQQADRALIVAQGRPSTAQPLHRRSRLGETILLDREPALLRAFSSGRPAAGPEGVIVGGIPVEQRFSPVRGADRKLIAVLQMQKSLLYRRPARPSGHPVLRSAARALSRMLFLGTIDEAAMLRLLYSGDGIVIRDPKGIIRYADARARVIYRKIGLTDEVIGHALDERRLPEAVLLKTLKHPIHTELEIQVPDAVIIKRTLPLIDGEEREGELSVVCDVTDLRRRQRQLLVKSAVIQEIHHRVKNNLQTIASMLRLQSRRARSRATREALAVSVSRILSIATVHDYLAQEGTEAIDLKELSQSLAEAALRLARGRPSAGEDLNLFTGYSERGRGTAAGRRPAGSVQVKVVGPNTTLDSDQATPLALALNELVINSVKHGLAGRRDGSLHIGLEAGPEGITIRVEDDGEGLPEGFFAHRRPSLGLQIVETLVCQDLQGEFSIAPRPGGGTVATISIPTDRKQETGIG